VTPFSNFIIVPVLLILLASCSASESPKIETPSKSPLPSETELSIESGIPPLNIGHRGARSLAPENTLASARKALEIGADMWELDVAVTSDDELVVLHDDTLDRTCNVRDLFPGKVPWRVWEFTLDEVKTLDCGSWFNKTDPFGQIKAGAVSQGEMESYIGEPIPTLREALEFTRENHWRVNVELKDQYFDTFDQVIVEKSVNLIAELGMDDGVQVVVSSFNHEYLRNVHSLNPNIPIQALTSVKIKDLSGYLANLGTNTCNPNVDVWSKVELKNLGREGILFNVWTVNDESTMRELITANVHGIFTDYPQVLKHILDENK
jgi:glycerophosphoryl diester phosphodiesterase